MNTNNKIVSYKIAFLIPSLDDNGGVVISIKTLYEYLNKIGHEVHLFAFGQTKNYFDNNVHIINEKNDYKQFKELFDRENTKKEFDFIASNNMKTAKILHKLNTNIFHAYILRQASLFNVKFNIIKLIKHRFILSKLFNGKNLIMISNCLRDEFLRKHTYIRPASTHLIYNSFDEFFINNKANEKIELPNFPYILSLGRQTKNKNNIFLIEAFQKIQNKDIKLILLGEGKETAKLKSYVVKNKLKDRILFIPWVKNPYPFIKYAKLVVSTSKSETFGRTILESLSLNVPVISTDIKCGPNEILTDELSDFLIPLGNVDLLKIKIENVLKNYPIIDTKYLKKFQVDVVCNQFIDMISKAKHVK